MVNIAALGNPEIAAQIGKKGTESDITMYNYKGREGTITFMHPNRYPERLPPLLFSVNLAHGALLTIESLDRTLGEEIVALDMRRINRGIIVLRNYIMPEQVEPLRKGTVLDGYSIIDDPIRIRENLASLDIPHKDGATLVPVDHFFPVKGVGTVILGTVMRGTVEKHQELQIYPSERKVQVKSIQIHDRDVDTAGTGSRVGLALKGIKPDELERGITLAEPGSMLTGETFEIEPEFTPFWKGSVKAGMSVHLSSGTQFTAGKMLDESTVHLEKKLAYTDGEEMLLIQADSIPRIIGRTELEVKE